MSTSLTLLPKLSESFWFCHDILRLDDDSDLFREILLIKPSTVPEPVSCHMATRPDGERGYGEVTEDSYGDPLGWVSAGALVQLRRNPAIAGSDRNRAALAYLAELPPTWPIVLYWH
ncbi:hypothetical protein ACVILK_000699 [Bradyrhizobium embrapense]